jgi:hypothetical protein
MSMCPRIANDGNHSKVVRRKGVKLKFVFERAAWVRHRHVILLCCTLVVLLVFQERNIMYYYGLWTWNEHAASRSEICFVTSVFAPPSEEPDRPPDVAAMLITNPTFKFYAFTNREDLDAPGWTKIIKQDLPYKRFITQSRYGKFLSWKEKVIQKCEVVFYIDGYVMPNYKATRLYREYAAAIKNSTYGLAQVRHPKPGGLIAEFARIVEHEKDFINNVNASIMWLLAQPDFQWNCTLYENTQFGFAPSNLYFQNVSTFFWDHYSLESDSWRDQPLWCYAMDHFGITPVQIPNSLKDEMFVQDMKRLGHGHHRYSSSANDNAQRLRTSPNKKTDRHGKSKEAVN